MVKKDVFDTLQSRRYIHSISQDYFMLSCRVFSEEMSLHATVFESALILQVMLTGR